ncbi:MAG: hypothetical protein AABW83_00595 [Nanoarchaeota archaeon]
MISKTTYADSGVNINLGDDVSKIFYNAAKQTWDMGQGMIIATPNPEEVIKIAENYKISAKKWDNNY